MKHTYIYMYIYISLIFFFLGKRVFGGSYNCYPNLIRHEINYLQCLDSRQRSEDIFDIHY